MAAEADAADRALRENPKWGNWRLKRRAFVLEHSRDGYQIPLERCGNPAAILDWLVQLSKKSWCTREDLGHLLAALDALLNLRTPEYCAGGGPGDETEPVNVFERLKRAGWVRRKGAG